MGNIFSGIGHFFKENMLLILLTLCALIVFIIVLSQIIRINRKTKEQREAAIGRARDERLNNYILNQRSSVNNKEIYVPYDVDYTQGPSNVSINKKILKDPNALMLHISEKTEFSERKFALNAVRGIHIGTAKENDIVMINDGRLNYKFELFVFDGLVYVRDNIYGSGIMLIRKRQRMVVDTNGVIIKSGDIIVAGTYSYTITFVD